jgi:excisionase family DNA binding protein
MTKDFLNISDLSEYLSIKKSTLYLMVESGDMPHYRIGRLIRFRRDDVDAWIETHRRKRIEIDRRAKEILKITARPNNDISRIVKKTIEEVKNRRYNVPHGKPDRIKGLRKEVENGTL